jgi:hypothetical protein
LNGSLLEERIQIALHLCLPPSDSGVLSELHIFEHVAGLGGHQVAQSVDYQEQLLGRLTLGYDLMPWVHNFLLYCFIKLGPLSLGEVTVPIVLPKKIHFFFIFSQILQFLENDPNDSDRDPEDMGGLSLGQCE